MDKNFSAFNYEAIVEALDEQEGVYEVLDNNKDVVDKTYWESLEKSCVTKGKMEYLQSSIDLSITLMYNKVQTTSYLDQQHTQCDKETEGMKAELEELNLYFRNLVDNVVASENELCEKLKNLSINFQSDNMVQETENLALSIVYKNNKIKEAKAKLSVLKNRGDDCCLDQESINNSKTVIKQCSDESLTYGESNKIAARLAEVKKNSEYLRKKIDTIKYKIQ